MKSSEDKQMSFSLKTNVNTMSDKSENVVRSITKELESRRNSEDAKIFSNIISRANHILK